MSWQGIASIVSWQGTSKTLAWWQLVGFTFKMMMLLMLLLLVMFILFSVDLRRALFAIDRYVALGVLLAHCVLASWTVLRLRCTCASGKFHQVSTMDQMGLFNGIQVLWEHHWTTYCCLLFPFAPYVSLRSSLVLFLRDVNNRFLCHCLDRHICRNTGVLNGADATFSVRIKRFSEAGASLHYNKKHSGSSSGTT